MPENNKLEKTLWATANKLRSNKATTLEEGRKNNHILRQGRYFGAEAEEDDGIPFDDKMKTLTAKLAEQFARGKELKKAIRENLKEVGYEF